MTVAASSKVSLLPKLSKSEDFVSASTILPDWWSFSSARGRGDDPWAAVEAMVAALTLDWQAHPFEQQALRRRAKRLY